MLESVRKRMEIVALFHLIRQLVATQMEYDIKKDFDLYWDMGFFPDDIPPVFTLSEGGDGIA